MCATVYGWRHLVKATEVTAGLAESNGSLQPGGWLKVTCVVANSVANSHHPGLLVHRDQLRAQLSVTSIGELYLLRCYIGHWVERLRQ